MQIKDQSSVSRSGEWLRSNPQPEPNPVTERIDSKHFLKVRREGVCLACLARTLRKQRRALDGGGTGGLFLMCSDCGWYIGYRLRRGFGEQARVERWRTVNVIEVVSL